MRDALLSFVVVAAATCGYAVGKDAGFRVATDHYMHVWVNTTAGR